MALGLRTVSIALLAAVSVASLARAGFSVHDPLGTGSCGTISVVANDLQDPNYFAISDSGITPKQCIAACKATLPECKRTVLTNGACLKQSFQRELTFALLGCTLDEPPELVRECELEQRADTVTTLGNLGSSVDDQLAQCATWETECETECVDDLAM